MPQSVEIAIAAAVIYTFAIVWLGGYVAAQKGRDSLEGVLLALFFSVVGVIVEGLLPDRPRNDVID